MSMFKNTLEMRQTFLLLNNLGKFNSKKLFHTIGAQVINNDSNEVVRAKYMKQLKKVHFCYTKMYNEDLIEADKKQTIEFLPTK